MRKRSNFLLVALPIIVLFTCKSILATQNVYISGVPDWDQPVLAAIPPESASGPWGAWCVPTAMANIVGYYNDKGVSGIGDNQAFPTTAPWPDMFWQDETADAVSPNPSRSDIGWYFNSNDLGLGANPSPLYRGTKLEHIMNGASGGGGLLGGGTGYFPSRSQSNITARNLGSFLMNPTVFSNFDTYGPPQSSHDYPFGWSEIMLAINSSQPLLAHFDHFNLVGKTRASDPNLGDYDWATWAAPPSYPTSADETSGEVWDPSQGLGHTVTVVGFWPGGDPCNPLGADAIIVHENMDGTLTAILPLPLVLPWPGSPWAGLTVIDNGLQPPLVVSPNGGEAIIAGSNATITWQNFGTIADVAIEFSTNNGSSWSNVSPPNAGNSGTYNWLTPVVDSNECLVRVNSAVTSALTDTSDNLFTIYQCTLSYDLDGNCFIDFFDVALLFSEWLRCGNPFDPACTP